MNESTLSFDRVLLAVLAAFVLLAGTGCLVAPASFAQQAGYSTSPSALTEIRAYYGGLQIGIGVFLAWCLRAPDRVLPGLLLAGLAVGSAGIARSFGVAIDHASTSHHLVNMGIEVVTVLLVVIALARARRRPARSAV